MEPQIKNFLNTFDFKIRNPISLLITGGTTTIKIIKNGSLNKAITNMINIVESVNPTAGVTDPEVYRAGRRKIILSLKGKGLNIKLAKDDKLIHRSDVSKIRPHLMNQMVSKINTLINEGSVGMEYLYKTHGDNIVSEINSIEELASGGGIQTIELVVSTINELKNIIDDINTELNNITDDIDTEI